MQTESRVRLSPQAKRALAVEVRELLDMITEPTSDAVAKRLVEYEVVGVPEDLGACPIARFLSARLVRPSTIEVTVDGVEVWPDEAIEPEVFTIPDTLVEFIDRFDDVEFPRLINWMWPNVELDFQVYSYQPDPDEATMRTLEDSAIVGRECW